MTTRIGWCVAGSHCSELLYFPPEVPRAGVACPSIHAWMTSGVLLRAPYDIVLHVDPDGDQPALRWGKPGPQNDVYQSFAFVPPQAWPRPDQPMVFWDLRNLFVADGPAVVETAAPFFDAGFQDWPGTLVPQRFNLARELRPLNWPFLWTDITRPLEIKRGDPLMYVRFQGAHADAGFRVEAVPYSSAMAEALRRGGPPPAGLLPAVEASTPAA